MMAWFARWLFRHRWAGWTILAVITMGSVIGIARLEYDDDLRSYLRSYRHAQEDFGSLEISDEAFVCIVQGDRLFEGDEVARLIEFDQEMRKVPGVRKVASIFSGIFSGSGDLSDLAAVSQMVSVPTPNSDGNQEVRRISVAESLFLGRSGRTLLFVAEPEPDIRLVKDLIPVQIEIERLLGDLTRRTGLKAEIAGVTPLRILIIKMARREQLVYSIGSCLLGGIVALIMFRRAAVLAVVIPVPIVSIIWVTGAMGLAGEPVNALNIMIAVIIPIISLTDAIHLTDAIRRHLVAGIDPRRAASEGLAEVGSACFMTCFTTAVSFASLLLSSNAAVARFGVFCAFGSISAYLAVILFTPLAASVFPGHRLVPLRNRHASTAFFAWLADFVSRHPRAIVAVSGIIFVAATMAHLRLGYDFRYSENLDPTSTARQAIDRLDSEFGGSQPLAIVALWPGDQAIESQRILKVLEAIHTVVEDPDRTGRPFSIWSLWKEATFSRPEARLEDLGKIFPGLPVDGLLDMGRGAALVKIPLRDQGAKVLVPFLDRIERRLRGIEQGHPGFRIQIVGLTAASIRNSEPLIRELTASLFTAGLVIFISIGLSVRSWSLGLVSIFPNVFPMVMAGAWLYLSGQDIRYVSALCFSICLGVAVDDTIHFLFRYRENRIGGLEPAPAIKETLITIGTSLVTTAAILVVGFALLLTSEVPTIRQFGVMGILILGLALVGDLLVLPALLLFRKRRDVTTEPGGEPSQVP
jgi:predicted RND superfamily exporter protein